MKTEDLKNNKDYKYGFTTDVRISDLQKDLAKIQLDLSLTLKKNLNGC